MGATPDYSAMLSSIWGSIFDDSGWSLSAASTASNIIVGTNPPYDSAMFFALYPNFEGLVPDAVLNTYIMLASASIMQARYLSMWPMVMGLFIAHYLTLWLQSQSVPPGSTAEQVSSAGLALGIQVAQSAGDVSESKQALNDLNGWGTFQLTLYGQQFATIAKAIGSGPMFIW